MSKDIGTTRVLTALAETVSGFSETEARWDDGDPGRTEQLDATLAAPEQGGAVIDGPDERYSERALLGRGGLGEVVEVYDRDLRREVALKRPRPERRGASHVAALVEEAQIQGQLEHPNIPSVHALGIDAQGRPFFTMTRLRGQTLSELLRERQEDPEVRAQVTTGRLLRIFLQIGSAMAFAHERGVVHRDLKPENVMIGAFGEVRVMDWGIAKLTGATGVTTSVERPARSGGDVAGTPGYAAPEQLGGGGDVDVRTDVYGLGAVLFEMLSGRPPIVGKTTGEVIDATLAGNVTRLTRLVPVSDRLEAIVHKALAMDPAQRYPDVLALLHDVEAMLEGRSVSVLQEGSLKRLGRFYMSQSARYARFRTVDVDMLSWGMYGLGMCSGMGLMMWDSSYAGPIAIALLVISLISLAVPAYTALRKPRPDDPGTVIPFSEGLTTSYASRDSTPSAEQSAETVAAEPDGETQQGQPPPREP